MEATFTALEYVLLTLTLLISLGIGLYYGLCKKQNTAKEYLHGGKNMNFLAVSLSIISSALSGITLMSVPTEVYFFGTHYVLTFINIILTGFVSYYLVTPVFYNLNITSIYEYLELRFNRKIKIFSSFLYAVQILLYMPLVIYTPGLAIAQMTKINVHLITPVLCIICIVYTVLGGIKAVIWTDAVQFVIMVGSILAVLIMGVRKVGGIENVFKTSYDTGRLSLDFDLDPTKRDTFWAAFIGGFAQLMAMYVYSQGNIQKYLALNNYRDVKKTHIVSQTGFVTVVLLSIFSGMIMIAAYIYCDPLSQKEINRPDQLLAYFVMDINTAFPGLAGVFVAGIVSASLSTLSAGMNSLAATTYNDFLRGILPERIVRNYEATTLKVLVLSIGVVCVALIYVVEHLGNLLPLVFSVIAITIGPLSGLFTLGLFMPKINSQAALLGSISSLLITGIFIVLVHVYKIKGWLKTDTLPVYTNSCISEIPISSHLTSQQENVDVPAILKISYYYYIFIGTLLTILLSWICNFFTRPDSTKVNDEYLSPIVLYCRRERKKIPAYAMVDTALKITSDYSDTEMLNSKEVNKS